MAPRIVQIYCPPFTNRVQLAADSSLHQATPTPRMIAESMRFHPKVTKSSRVRKVDTHADPKQCVASSGTQHQTKRNFHAGKTSFYPVPSGTTAATLAKSKMATSPASAAPTFAQLTQTAPKRFAPRRKKPPFQPKNTKTKLKRVSIKSKQR